MTCTSTTAEPTPAEEAATDLRRRVAAVPTTKAATVRKMLARARGATLDELTVATGWQPHSVRAFLSGVRKQGKPLVREARKSGDPAYRFADSAANA